MNNNESKEPVSYKVLGKVTKSTLYHLASFNQPINNAKLPYHIIEEPLEVS